MLTFPQHPASLHSPSSFLENFSNIGKVFIQGDFNAYTKIVDDFVVDNGQYPFMHGNEYITDSKIPRNTMDVKNFKL